PIHVREALCAYTFIDVTNGRNFDIREVQIVLEVVGPASAHAAEGYSHSFICTRDVLRPGHQRHSAESGQAIAPGNFQFVLHGFAPVDRITGSDVPGSEPGQSKSSVRRLPGPSRKAAFPSAYNRRGARVSDTAGWDSFPPMETLAP